MVARLNQKGLLMSDIPEITTSRLILRPIRPSDVDDIHRYVSNPDVLRYTSWQTPRELSETKEFVRRLVNKPEGAFTLAICLKENTGLIGIVEFGTRKAKGGIDYSLAAEQWNRGIMTEVVQAVIDWGFNAYPAAGNNILVCDARQPWLHPRNGKVRHVIRKARSGQVREIRRTCYA